MNTSTNTTQTRAIARGTARTTASGFRRRSMAGALLIGTLTATAVGFASPSHADDAAPAPNVDATATVPAPVTPWLPALDGYAGRWRIHCGFPGWQGPFRCWY